MKGPRQARYTVRLKGLTPLLMHNGAAGLDTRLPANQEKAKIAKKRGSNRTLEEENRLRELEVYTSLWLDADDRPTIIPTAMRAAIETAARSLKQGPQVRGGLTVVSTDEFEYDEAKLGTTLDELCENAQFTVAVVVQRSRLLRTRAIFEDWAVTFTVEVETDLVDQGQLEDWLTIAGRRIGLGDWRPEKSGQHGKFEVLSIELA